MDIIATHMDIYVNSNYVKKMLALMLGLALVVPEVLLEAPLEVEALLETATHILMMINSGRVQQERDKKQKRRQCF